ncbi:MAG: tRNA dihydrouridine synthase DusB [Bacteroidetes bacterium]|nr:tRNA dihydrouridine synthase DusB [Bacteroidota bacterium]
MKIGKINIDKPLLLAPMEDVTDISFRLICKELGADIMYTEFVNAEGIARNSEKTIRKMHFIEEERAFGIQLYGGGEISMEVATNIANSLEPDIIDINCGCWVKNVALNGAGAGLLRDLPQMKKIVLSAISNTKIPVTVKTRLGWDSNNINIIEVAKMLEDVGIEALTIHCRTRAHGNFGEVDYSWIEKVKQSVKIPIIVNGNIYSPNDVKAVFDKTGCDGVMIARGAIDNPWIFKQTKEYLKNGTINSKINFLERVNLVLKHLQLSLKYKGEKRGIIELRKHYSGYFKGIPNISKLRNELMLCTEQSQIEDKLFQFLKYFKNSEEINLATLTEAV